MSTITIPTPAEIRDRIIQDFENTYGQTVPILERAFIRTLATDLAGSFWLLYKDMQRVGLNQLPTTAEGDRLDEWGAIVDLPRQTATQFKGTATVTGTDGTIVQAGTLWRSANGIQYITTTSATIASGSATIDIQSQTTGEETNLAVSDVLNISNPQSGIDSSATVASVVNSAEDREADEDYRVRIIDRFARRPQGGALIDYVLWAETVSGVTRVFPYESGVGSVDVYFLRDNDADRIPDASEILEVFDAIDQPDRRPLGSTVTVLAPTEIEFDVTVTGFVGTPSAQASLETAIESYFLNKEMYVDANISDDDCNVLRQFDLIGLVQQYGTASAVDFEVTGSGTSLTTYTLSQGEVAKASTITITT